MQNQTSIQTIKGLFFTFFLATLTLALAGCLKTRAQLRNQNQTQRNQDGSVPVQVTPVQTGGQRGVVDELKNEINQLSGRIEELERTNQELRQKNETDESEKKLEARIQELEAAQVQLIEALKKKEKEAPPQTESLDQFTQGKGLYTQKKYGAAIQSFSEYLKFKNGKNREEALFLRGESFFQTKDYKKAILDYSEINEKFKKSRLMPKVLYKIALSFEFLGLPSDAKAFYQELVDQYPKSAEAKKSVTKIK